MKNKQQKTKNKLHKKLTKIGFKKIPSDDGFVMYELTPSKLNAAALIHDDGVEKPETTAPGATQFELTPVNAILVSVPVFEFPEASINVVIKVFEAEAKP